jgi:hypothetical protein
MAEPSDGRDTETLSPRRGEATDLNLIGRAFLAQALKLLQAASADPSPDRARIFGAAAALASAGAAVKRLAYDLSADPIRGAGE